MKFIPREARLTVVSGVQRHSTPDHTCSPTPVTPSKSVLFPGQSSLPPIAHGVDSGHGKSSMPTVGSQQRSVSDSREDTRVI